MPFIIILNKLQALDLIVEALKLHPSASAHQLAEGVEEYTLWQRDDGTAVPAKAFIHEISDDARFNFEGN